MKIHRAHKICLKPSNAQANYFARACGVARKAYNWGLEQWGKLYANGEKPSAYELKKQFNAIKREQFPYVFDVTKSAAEQAFTDLGRAFTNFFRNVKQGKKPGYPRFKKRGQHDTFYIANDRFRTAGNRICIPKLGWVRMTEALRFAGEILSATISRTANKWFVAISVEIEIPEPVHDNQGAATGVDLGVSVLASLANGEKIAGPKPHRSLMKRLRGLNKALARKRAGSSNWKRTKQKLAKLHARIANIRRDALHKLTTRLVAEYGLIGIEDLNVAGMSRNHCLARSILDMGFGEFARQLGYKATAKGSRVVVADRFFPSTKACSACGQIHDMPLSKRTMKCSCGLTMDRDQNAAINLKQMAVGSTVSARRPESAGSIEVDRVKLSVGQEFLANPC